MSHINVEKQNIFLRKIIHKIMQTGNEKKKYSFQQSIFIRSRYYLYGLNVTVRTYDGFVFCDTIVNNHYRG